MSKQATDISIVLDKSGSMSAVRHDTIGGFNTFLKDQAALPGEATISLTVFDTEVKPLYAGKPVRGATLLNETTYQPSGGTALLDAVGRSIIATGNRLSAIPEGNRPEKVMFVIFTDGEENSSHEFDYKQISDMITHQREVYHWSILFVGADQDAIANAAKLGVKRDQAISTANNSGGTQSYYSSLSKKARVFRSAPGGQSLKASVDAVGFDDQDREEQSKAGAKQP